MFEFSFFFFLIPCAKLKPDYFDEMSETADLLVIGGNWSASRNGTISTLYCALVDDRHETDEPEYVHTLRLCQLTHIVSLPSPVSVLDIRRWI